MDPRLHVRNAVNKATHRPGGFESLLFTLCLLRTSKVSIDMWFKKITKLFLTVLSLNCSTQSFSEA